MSEWDSDEGRVGRPPRVDAMAVEMAPCGIREVRRMRDLRNGA